MNDTPKASRPVGRTVTFSPLAAAAEIDAEMLAELREWHARQSPESLAQRGVRLEAAEFDLLMRLADKATEIETLDDARRRTEEDPNPFDPFGPLDFATINVEPSECTHDESTIANGGLVCGSCGKLIAWIIFKRPSA